jgi:hypothetical protein
MPSGNLCLRPWCWSVRVGMPETGLGPIAMGAFHLTWATVGSGLRFDLTLVTPRAEVYRTEHHVSSQPLPGLQRGKPLPCRTLWI